MKKELKFRAFDKVNNNMTLPFYIRDVAHGNLFLHDFTEVKWEFLEFTGLHDKNGKEIYEGDVLYGFKRGSNSDRFYTGVIEWQTDQAGWVIRCSKYIMEILSLSMSGDGIETRLDSFEIIGNIHEHPHLLTPSTVNKKEVGDE